MSKQRWWVVEIREYLPTGTLSWLPCGYVFKKKSLAQEDLKAAKKELLGQEFRVREWAPIEKGNK